MELPGGELYQDVRDLFEEAAAEMDPGEMIWTEGFTLQEAMSALEVGEPRLDSGMRLEADKKKSFDPVAPMLPEEVCWIIDRSFAYEMEWHAGNPLSNTVFTLLYVHQLGEIDPDVVPFRYPQSKDQTRRIELISVVLRTYILGLLKCCGSSWDALNRSTLHDGEDWQADKCEVSLLEGYQVQSALAKIDETLQWILTSPKVSPEWRDALYARLNMRRILLRLMNTNIFDHLEQFQTLIREAHSVLDFVRAHPPPELDMNSPARLAFDPYIARRLVTFMPIRVLDLPPIDKTWNALEQLLHGWTEMAHLSISRSLLTWEIKGSLRIWQQVDRSGYIRCRTQACFHDGLLALGRFSTAWFTQSFLNETLGTSQETIFRSIQSSWIGKSPPPLTQLERTIANVLIPTISGFWNNAPRRRRQLTKLAFEWHVLYDMVLTILDNVDEQRPRERAVLRNFPVAVLMWRMSIVQELVLSGFQLELYAPDERPFAYWYTAQIIEQHISCLDGISSVLSPDSPSGKEMTFRRQLLTALQLMCIAMYSVLSPALPFDWARMKYNFMRRYKWVFSAKYQDVLATPVGHPELFRFLPAMDEVLNDQFYSPAASCDLAHEIFSTILESEDTSGWAGFCSQDRIKSVNTLLEAADNLRQHLPTSMEAASTAFDWKKTLKWNPEANPWFPVAS